MKALETNSQALSFSTQGNEDSVIYMGQERRNERRRGSRNERVEVMLKNFGLERRSTEDRRKEGTSWLLTSKKVVNQ